MGSTISIFKEIPFFMIFRYAQSLLFCFGVIQSAGQADQDITFRRVSPPGGFSIQAVHSFDQDAFGYIWMGSFDGVFRYNSREVTRFIYNPKEPNGLPSGFITSLVIDNQNNIWVTSEKGLYLFNHELQKFERSSYTYENGETASNNLFYVETDGSGQLWIADENFFGYLDHEKKQLVRIVDGLGEKPRLLYKDETNRLWLGTLNGSVYLVIPQEKRVVKKVEGPGSRARTIYANNSEIWVGYESHGARLFDLDGKLKLHYDYPSNAEFDFKSTSVRRIWRDTRGQIWIGSYNGLFLGVGSELIHFAKDEYVGIPHNSIYDIFEDEQGGIWVGTWSGGVSYMHHADNRFSNFRQTKDPLSISDNMISSFAQMPSGDLLVGTEQGGLNTFDLETSSFRKIADLESQGGLNVKALHVDRHEGLWVACAFKGVYYRPKGQSNFLHFALGEEDGKHISALGVYTLCESDSGIWMGTNFGGLNFYDFQTKRISFKSKELPFSQIDGLNIRSLTLDSYNHLWAATSHGVYQFHLPSGRSTHFTTSAAEGHQTNSQSFHFVTELSDGTIWMGTSRAGINIYHPRTDGLSSFDANGLLKGKDVYGIIHGHEDHLWITSNDGLILYNTRHRTSRRFIITDGIQGNLFNPNAIFKDQDGNLYFGGTNGFTLLEPKAIRINQRTPNVLINNIRINNREVVPTQTGINKFAKLVLSPKETTLSFNFSADNFLLPEKNKFMYRLNNYVDEWVSDVNTGSATFVNIPAGEYLFEVKACNNDGLWNSEPAQLLIVVQQYWYKSTIALVFYSIVALTIIGLIIRFYRERLKLKKALLIEKIKHEQEERLHEMKIRFFTNISHEFRTPLTLINWPVENLLKSKNLSLDDRGQLETIKKNTNRLLQLIGQILAFRKFDAGQAKLNLSQVELVAFIRERIHHFSEEAKAKKIQCSFSHGPEKFLIEADEEKLDKIIYNLLSNAFKFTPTNERIRVSLPGNLPQKSSDYTNQLSFGKLEHEDFVEIHVIDSGGGIDSEDLPHIFNRFEQGKHEKARENSTGIGLTLCKDYTLLHGGVIVVQSTPGEGSCFSVRLPIRQKAQKIFYETNTEITTVPSWEITEKNDVQSRLTDKDTKILVVEDNADLRRYITKFLQDFYCVLFADDGHQGLEILKRENVQLVISDVMMPVMDGFQFCQKIKSQIETSHIPVILLTALSSAENQTVGLEKGADAYISKPFDENVLLSRIENLLQQRKRLQESYTKMFFTGQPIDIGSLDNYFLNRINAIIEKNIEDESFSVTRLAVEMGLSRSQLHRKLKQISNRSTSEYITMIKVKKATTLLASKQYNIDEVAFKSGFNSHSYFTKCFKKIHHKSPSEFLKELSK